MGAGRASNPELVAVVDGPEGRKEMFRRSFLKMYSHPLEFPHGIDRDSGFEALNQISDELLKWGFDPDSDGQESVWYGLHFWRPYVPPERLSEDLGLVAALEEFLRSTPYNSHALAAYAYYNLNHGEYEAAAQNATAALRIRPTHVIALSVLAASTAMIGDEDEACSYARKAIELAPGFEMPQDILKTIQSYR